MARDIIKESHAMHAINPNCGVVYNGKSAEEWYTLYCQAVLRCKRLEDQIEEKAEADRRPQRAETVEEHIATVLGVDPIDIHLTHVKRVR